MWGYLRDIDCVWIASDRNGHLGAFVTGGDGPIPAVAMNNQILPIEEIEEKIGDLPKVSEATILIVIKRPDDFIALAERGFFVYDWRDVHRIARECTNSYEQVAVPLNPIKANALSKTLACLVADITFDYSVFLEEKILDVYTQFKQFACRDGGSK